jgi:hypothetical protein
MQQHRTPPVVPVLRAFDSLAKTGYIARTCSAEIVDPDDNNASE